MREHRPVLVPSDPRPDAILYDERLFERVGIDPGKASGAAADRVEPERDRLAGRETSGLEVIGPAERARQPFAFPLLKLERREPRRLDAGDQRSLLGRSDDLVAIGEARKQRDRKST